MTDVKIDRCLIVSVVSYYGKETIKPECEVSRKFAELLGQKTLTRGNIEAIKGLGFEVKTKEVKL